MIKGFLAGAKWPKQSWSDVSVFSQAVGILDPVTSPDLSVLLKESDECSETQKIRQISSVDTVSKVRLSQYSSPISSSPLSLRTEGAIRQMKDLEAAEKDLVVCWLDHQADMLVPLSSTDDLTLLFRTASFLCARKDHGQPTTWLLIPRLHASNHTWRSRTHSP